jgi:hypothetical protein
MSIQKNIDDKINELPNDTQALIRDLLADVYSKTKTEQKIQKTFEKKLKQLEG